MAYFVFHDAKLGCTMGSQEPFLQVLDPLGQGYITGQKAANVKDCKPLININSFGMCKSMQNPSVQAATAANYGVLQQMPCIVPTIQGDKWENWQDSGMYIRGEKVLLNCATIDCVFRGLITITENISEGVQTGALGLGKDVLNDTDFNRDRGPGTQYINNKGQLIYRRRDGQTERLFIINYYDGEEEKKVRELEVKLKIAKQEGRINDPDNKNLFIGYTPEQYTGKKASYCKENPITFMAGYKEGYKGGGTSDVLLDNTLQTVGVVGHGAMNRPPENPYADGVSFGSFDKKYGIIDASNPTARIIPPALLTI